MNSRIQFTVIFLIAAIPLVLNGQESFIAEMINVQKGKKIVCQVQSDGNKYRYDFEEDGTKGIVIVDPSANKTAVLMPEKKFVFYTELMSPVSLMNDPCQSFRYMQKNYTEKKVGKEKISGFDAEKTELYAGNQKLYTAWYSDDLHFLIRMVNASDDNTYMELNNIKKGKIDADIFKVPIDYIEVDEKMRPVIPESPPPESWNKIQVSIPVKQEFKRGDIISFKIPESGNYKVILKNETDDPAKVIRISMRDGKELPDNEQGPLKYRTRRLYKGESNSSTYSWKEGDDKIIQVHEGKLIVEIMADK
ncbi:MAG TPA: hypothetical protein VJ963_03725, partial [Bacteroidales bacterium]|nr:hypothetical protein [Bacteroidales bacterium]